jgi:hypothetical protein
MVFAQSLLESPVGFVSGLGDIHGWKCDVVGKLTFIINNGISDGPPGQLIYGANRNDTQGICGDSDNGFITQFNWSLLPSGQYTIRVLDNGVQFAQSTFTVTRLGTEFVNGASSSCVARIDGQDVTLTWQENLQNFVITATTGGDTPPPDDDDTPVYPNVAGIWNVSLNYAEDNCGGSLDLPDSISGTANVSQDGGNLTVLAQGILEQDVLLTGNLATNGDFTVTSPPSSNTEQGCTYNFVASFSGNFQTGEGDLEVTATKQSGNCELFSLPCSVLYDGTFTKN